MPDLVSSPEAKSEDSVSEADFGTDSDNSVPDHDAMDDDSTAPTVNDIRDRLIDFSLSKAAKVPRCQTTQSSAVDI